MINTYRKKTFAKLTQLYLTIKYKRCKYAINNDFEKNIYKKISTPFVVTQIEVEIKYYLFRNVYLFCKYRVCNSGSKHRGAIVHIVVIDILVISGSFIHDIKCLIHPTRLASHQASSSSR